MYGTEAHKKCLLFPVEIYPLPKVQSQSLRVQDVNLESMYSCSVFRVFSSERGAH